MIGEDVVFRVSPLEVSVQEIAPVGPGDFTYSAKSDEAIFTGRPLHDLAECAPAVDEPTHMPDFAFSNDESASVLSELRVRTSLAEFREAPNRVAILVGEGALAASLRFIKEDTVVLLDMSPRHVAFMQKYVAALRGCGTIAEWMKTMRLDEETVEDDRRLWPAVAMLETQIAEWEASGFAHPLVNQEAYEEARELAQSKAIIPWRGSISDYKDMRKLGDALRQRNATVTLANLTNVPTCNYDFTTTLGGQVSCETYAEVLSALPFAPFAPILTTAQYRRGRSSRPRDFIVEATGPFFGLENLRRAGDYRFPEGTGRAVGERQYFMEPTELSEDWIEGPPLSSLELLELIQLALRRLGRN